MLIFGDKTSVKSYLSTNLHKWTINKFTGKGYQSSPVCLHGRGNELVATSHHLQLILRCCRREFTCIRRLVCLVCIAVHVCLFYVGNGYIGSNVLERLLTNKIFRYHEIGLVSRGSWNWGTETLIKPRVLHVSCDR